MEEMEKSATSRTHHFKSLPLWNMSHYFHHKFSMHFIPWRISWYCFVLLMQKKGILAAKPILQESIAELLRANALECLKMADMGCSSGPNTLLPLWEIIETIDSSCSRLNQKSPILQVFLNDLQGNDFNTIFRSLIPKFHKKREKEKGSKFGPCYIAAVPGSFYGRLFPPHSLHFIHSSYSLHWLSQVQLLENHSISQINQIHANIFSTWIRYLKGFNWTKELFAWTKQAPQVFIKHIRINLKEISQHFWDYDQRRWSQEVTWFLRFSYRATTILTANMASRFGNY